MLGFGRPKNPQKKEKTVKREKPAKHVYAVGEKVCFSLPDQKTREAVWHMGEIVSIVPPQNPMEKPTRAIVVLFELISKSPVVREAEDWETDAPPYFDVPREVLILDRLLSQLEWNDKKLAMRVEVELEKICLARHTLFLNLFAPAKQSLWDQMSPYRHKW